MESSALHIETLKLGAWFNIGMVICIRIDSILQKFSVAHPSNIVTKPDPHFSDSTVFIKLYYIIHTYILNYFK